MAIRHGNSKLSKDLLTKAIKRTGGNISSIVRVLKVSRPSVYSNIKRYELGSLVLEAREQLRDRALETIEENIDDVEVALKYLNIANKHQLSKIDISAGENVNILVVSDEAKDDLQNIIS